jgi:N-acetyl-anhydromuramyl-L-alanine amidase AmpD
MPTEAQIAASVALVRWLCEKLGLPMDRRHVVGHYESPTTTHEDCGLGIEDGGIWPWDGYLVVSV